MKQMIYNQLKYETLEKQISNDDGGQDNGQSIGYHGNRH